MKHTIADYAKSAELAREAGYDGIEIMGSEGYFINQFLSAATNHRTDEYGGSAQNRMRLPIEIVEQCRAAAGDDFIIVYRLSLLDLVPGGQRWDEVVELAQSIEGAGASIINTGIGWHEARVPTIVTSVPRAAFSWVTAKLKPEVGIPVVASNRINTPQVAEDVLAGAPPTSSRWRGHCSPTPTSSTRPRRGAPTRSTPVSPATRPAWTTSSSASTRAASSTRGRAAKPS